MKKRLLIICLVLMLAATGVIYGFTYRTSTSKTPAKKATKTQCTKFKSGLKASQVNYRLKSCNRNKGAKTSVAIQY